MSLFLPNIPQPGDNLDFSQPQLLSNNSGLDTVFGIDHYKFSDSTVNKGFHNTVTTPQFVTAPPVLPSVHPTTVANPVAYGYQQLDGAGSPTTNTGVLQYSRGPNNAVPTPLTSLHSTSAGFSLGSLASANVFNFAGLTGAIASISGGSQRSTLVVVAFEATVYWDGTTLAVANLTPTTGRIVAGVSGSTLQVTNLDSNTMNNIFWTLQFRRLAK